MNFLKKTSVAVCIAILVVALCCVWGYTRVNDQDPLSGTHYQPDRSSGESNLNYYLGWISDGARLFSADAIDAIARENLTLDNTYGSLVAVKTVSYLNGRDIQSYAEETALDIGLDRRDMLLFLDSSSESWYVTYGADLVTYVEGSADLPNLFRKHLNNAFWEEENTDQAIRALFEDLDDWYEENIPPLEKGSTGFLPSATKIQSITLGSLLSGILFTLLANLWWIALALIALNIIDRIRFDQFYAKKATEDAPELRFHPFLFWHRPGSNWYEDRMEEAMAEDEDEEEDNDEDDFDPPGESACRQEEEPDPDTAAPDGNTPEPRSLPAQVWDLFRTLADLLQGSIHTLFHRH